MLYGLLTLSSIGFKPDTDIPDLSGKVVLVTGGNVGLGKETILQLSKHNPTHIYLAGRKQDQAEAAIKEIQITSPNAKITYIQCDLASLKSVQACAREFTSKESRLDLLFLNAGVMAVPPALTSDGFEMQFGTNHVGHALLTKLLMPTLLKTAEQPGADVRVVSVSSIGHTGAKTIAFGSLKTDLKEWGTMSRYAQSKLSNILFTKSLNTHYGNKGITSVAVHPGMINTELYRTIFGGSILGGTLDKGLMAVKNVFWTSVQNGAKNQLWAGTAKEVKSGEYYTPVGVAGEGSKTSEDAALAEKLWDWTEDELKDYSL